MCVYYEYCVFSGRGLCDGLIFRPEMPYACVCVSSNVIRYNDNTLHLHSVRRMGQIRK